MSIPPGSSTPPASPPSSGPDGLPPNNSVPGNSSNFWDGEGMKLLAVVGAILGAMTLLAGLTLTGALAASAVNYDDGGRSKASRGGPHNDSGQGRGGRDFGNPGGQRDNGGLGDLSGLSGLRGNLELFSKFQHGDVVVTGPNGQPETKRIARGTIGAVTPTSVSVTSADGFVTAYTISATTTIMINGQSGAVTGLAVGQKASVIGTVAGATATADQVIATPA